MRGTRKGPIGWPLTAGVESPLSFLLRDVNPVEFFARHWGRVPLYVRGGDRNFDGLLKEPWRQARARSQQIRAVKLASDGRQAKISVSLKDLERRAPRNGVTICSDHRDPGLAAFMEKLRVELGLTGRTFFAQCYESSNKSGLKGHFDSAHVLVLQMEGEKRWLVSKSPLINYPAADAVVTEGRTIQGRRLRPPRKSECLDVILRSGDFLYVPPGAWHQPIARGHSMSLSLSPASMSMGQLLTAMLERDLDPEWQWRQLLSPLYDPQMRGRFPAARAQARRFIAQFRAFANDIDEREVLGAWLSAIPAPSVDERAMKRTRWIKTTRLRHVSPGALRVLVQGTEVSLHHGGIVATVSSDALPLVRWLAAHATFTLGEAAEAMRPAYELREVKKLTRILLEAGVLELM